MTAKQYLSQIRLLDLKINQRIQELEDVKKRAFSLGSPELKADVVQSSPSQDQLAESVSRYVDLEDEINQLIDKYVDLRDTIISKIHELNDPRYVMLLHCRYVDFMSMTEISEKMNYEYKYTCQLHGKALESFTKHHEQSRINP